MQYNTTASIPCNTFFSQNSNISSQTVVDAHVEENIRAALLELSEDGKKVALHIATYAAKEWGHCQKTYKTIARELDCCIKTVARVMRILKKYGIATIKRMGRKPSHIVVVDKFLSFFNKRPNRVQTKPPILYNKRKKIINRADDSFLHKSDSVSDKLTDNDLLIMSDLESLDLTLMSKMTILSEIKRLKLPRRAVLMAASTVTALAHKFASVGKSAAFNAGGYCMKVIRNNVSYKAEQLREQKQRDEKTKRDSELKESQENRAPMPSHLSIAAKNMRY